MTTYDLWDVGAGNIVGSFPTLDDCLVTVRGLLERFAEAYADELTISRRDGSGDAVVIATGQRLRGWAWHGAPEPTPA